MECNGGRGPISLFFFFSKLLWSTESLSQPLIDSIIVYYSFVWFGKTNCLLWKNEHTFLTQRSLVRKVQRMFPLVECMRFERWFCPMKHFKFSAACKSWNAFAKWIMQKKNEREKVEKSDQICLLNIVY